MRLEIECFMLRYPIKTKNFEMGLSFLPNLSSFGSFRSGGTSNNFERWASTVLVNGIKLNSMYQPVFVRKSVKWLNVPGSSPLAFGSLKRLPVVNYFLVYVNMLFIYV